MLHDRKNEKNENILHVVDRTFFFSKGKIVYFSSLAEWLLCKTSIDSWRKLKVSFIYYEAFAVDKLMAYLKLFSKKSTCIRILKNPQLFLSEYGYRPHISGEFDSESGKKVYPQRIR